MATTSRAGLRNADLRAAARAAFPGVKIGVRNGRGGYADITWVDGPTTTAMSRVLREVPSDTNGRPWGTNLHRSVSVLVTAVGYLRARAAGEWFFEETLRADGSPVSVLDDDLAPGTTLARWRRLEDTVDAGTISSLERLQATTLAVLAGCGDVDQVVDEESNSRTSRLLARSLHYHADVVDAVLAPAEATA